MADHFSALASRYAKYRPSYPRSLFQFLANTACPRTLAWDCACGNGQATNLLARHFEKVLATDVSAAQISRALPRANIEYRVESAEQSSIAAHSVNLITVAQAAHWLDIGRFNREVERVLASNGVVAWWTYGRLRINHDQLNAVVQNYYDDVIASFWPPQRHHVETQYAELSFPWQRIATPTFAMRESWSLAQLLGYLSSWSASARYAQHTGRDPVDEIAPALAALEIAPEAQFQAAWPLTCLVGRQS